MKPILVWMITLLVSLPVAGAAHAAPPLPDLPIPQSFGVNIHFMDQDLPDQVAWLKKAGFGWIRRDLDWNIAEPQKGVYDFGEFDRLVDAAAAANIRVLAILDYSNPLYDNGTSPISPEARTAFARFAAAAAAHYAGKGVIWEIYNEPNWNFWKPKPNADQYIAMAGEATQAIRAAVPDAVIVGPALAGPVSDVSYDNSHLKSLDFIDHVLAMPDMGQWSALTIHPYRNTQAPETAAPQLEQVRALIRKHGFDPRAMPVIFGEWGYSTWKKGVDEQTQAAYAARALLFATAQRMPFSIWYDWQDDGPNDSDREYRFGLLRAGPLQDKSEDAVAKPAFRAVERLSALLNGYRFDQSIGGDPSCTFLSFTKDNRRAFVLWSNDDVERDVPAAALPAGQWAVTPLLGDARALTIETGRPAILHAGKMPVVIAPSGDRVSD